MKTTHKNIVSLVSQIAIRSLYAELILTPKPGLVSPDDSGSHRDMNVKTFISSLLVLQEYFFDIAEAGFVGENFSRLKQLGLLAEKKMLSATEGINTHRGAIFSLGLLVAASSRLLSQNNSITNQEIGQTVTRNWGEAIAGIKPTSSKKYSHGLEVQMNYGVGGAKTEAVKGFPTLFKIGLPVMNEVVSNTNNIRLAMVQVLFYLMGRLQDTNLLYRGGLEGLQMVMGRARHFLDTGGIYRSDWEVKAQAVHKELVSLNLSPGGSADILSATWFVYHVQKEFS